MPFRSHYRAWLLKELQICYNNEKEVLYRGKTYVKCATVELNQGIGQKCAEECACLGQDLLSKSWAESQQLKSKATKVSHAPNVFSPE